MIEPPWLKIAREEVGVKEIAGPGDAPRVVEYHQSVDDTVSDDEIAWCSSFVNWCTQRSGFPGSRSRAARSWLRWGAGLAVPAMGCVGVMWRESPDSWKGHVGFVVGLTADEVQLLGGNQRSRVCVRSYPRDRFLGWRWPAAG